MIQNKHIIRLSFIGLFLNIVANIVLYRYYMIEEVIIKQVADQNSHIASLYSTKVWENFPNETNKLEYSPYQSLLQDPNFINFVKESSDFFGNIKDDISLFDKHGNILFVNHETITTETIQKYQSKDLYNLSWIGLDKYFLKEYTSDHPLSDAFGGETKHSLISRSIITDDNGNESERSLISSYIPIIDTASGRFAVQGVIEITTDITQQWDNITYLEKRIFIAFVIIFFVFFIIVMYNTNYAQRIINKQIETNKALEEAKTLAESESSAKTEFLANVSHELRTPLNAVIGFSEIMIAETYGKIENEQYRSYIIDINNSGKHLLSVINDILDFSKASADKLTVEMVELNLNKLVSSSMRFVKPRADEAGVALIEQLPSEPIIIIADPKRLKQAILNLLSNSVKFTQSGGSITLSISKDKTQKLVYITVVDTGIGMTDKDIPKALSSFGQVDNKLSRKYEGTGLGLPLTKKLVELMHGVFDLKSKPGVGTTVTISFAYSDDVIV